MAHSSHRGIGEENPEALFTRLIGKVETIVLFIETFRKVYHSSVNVRQKALY